MIERVRSAVKSKESLSEKIEEIDMQLDQMIRQIAEICEWRQCLERARVEAISSKVVDIRKQRFSFLQGFFAVSSRFEAFHTGLI